MFLMPADWKQSSVFGYGSKISGNCILEDYVIFGGNVLMSQGSRVGAWAMIQTGCSFP